MDAIDEEASATEQTSRQATVPAENDDQLTMEELEPKGRTKPEKCEGPGTRENTFGSSAEIEKPERALHGGADDHLTAADGGDGADPDEERQKEIRDSLPGAMYDSKLREDYIKSKEN